MALKIFEFVINPEDSEMGMKAISIVDKPAMESQYIAFNKQEVIEKRRVEFKGIDDKKYIIAGLALIPNKLIYRVDEKTEEEYLGYFSEETIEMIVDKFLKEAKLGTTQEVNFGHNDEDKAEAHLIESFIIRTDEMAEAIKGMGIEDAVKGAWYVAYKFDNEEAYEKAVDGGFTGYSVEVVLQKELKLSKNNINDNNKFMTKVKDFIDKFKSLLTEFESDDVKLDEAKIADSDVVLRWGEVGEPVVKVAVDEDGSETLEPVGEGEYILDNGNVLVVDEMGNLVEVKENADAPAPIPEEDLEKKDDEEEYEKKDDEDEEKNEKKDDEEDLKEDEDEDKDSDLDKTLRQLIPLDKNGEYSIMVSVYDGVLAYGSMSSWTEIKLKAEEDKQKEIDALNEKLAEMEKEKNELTEKLENLEVKPIFTQYTEVKPKKVTKEDMRKMSNLDYQLKKLGIDKEE